MDMIRTARFLVASQIHVAAADDMVAPESPDHQDQIRIEEIVVMPCRLVRVHEQGDVAQGRVVVDDVGEVDHRFMALVHRHRQSPGAAVIAVDRIDGAMQMGVFIDKSVHPGRVVFLQFGHYQVRV